MATTKTRTLVGISMRQNSGHDYSKPSDGVDYVNDLTKQMAKLWWTDKDKETTDSRMAPDTTQGYNADGENFWVGKAKYLASLSIQASMEKLWAKELYNMDSKEREDIANEIHGVRSSRAIQETPEVIFEGIQLLRDYIELNVERNVGTLDDIVPADITRKAYKRVLFSELTERGQNIPYIHTEKFLIKFLRASYFDVEKAGLRYFRWLDLMYDIFGDIAFKRPLMMTDLTNREIRYLKKGQMQLLPSRDRVGRRIFAFSGRTDRNFTFHEKFRTFLYIYDVCSEDEATQKLGLVSLQSPKIDPGVKPFGEEGMALRSERNELLGDLTEKEILHKFNKASPLRVSALHYTGPDTFIYHIGKALILFLLDKDDRKIVRFHGGSQMECNYSLRSFGIPSEEVPITEEGHIKNKKVAKFIAARNSIEAIRQQQYRQHQFQYQYQYKHQHQERGDAGGSTITVMQPIFLGVECPEVNCIIFGNRARYNTANLEFRNILKVMERNREEKIARSEHVPTVREYINSIIQTAKSPVHNLRFLAINRKTSLFVEIEDSQELYSTVSQALRDQRKRTRMECRILDQKDQSDSDGGGSGGSIMGSDASKRQKGSSSCCDI